VEDARPRPAAAVVAGRPGRAAREQVAQEERVDGLPARGVQAAEGAQVAVGEVVAQAGGEEVERPPGAADERRRAAVGRPVQPRVPGRVGAGAQERAERPGEQRVDRRAGRGRRRRRGDDGRTEREQPPGGHRVDRGGAAEQQRRDERDEREVLHDGLSAHAGERLGVP
jgi:hypothetical protein